MAATRAELIAAIEHEIRVNSWSSSKKDKCSVTLSPLPCGNDFLRTPDYLQH